MYRSILAAAILVALATPAMAHGDPAATADAQQTTQTNTDQQTQDDQQQKKPDQSKSTKLKTITVTGSLIPRSQIETSTPHHPDHQ